MQPSGQGWRENSLQLLSGFVFPSQADARTPSLCSPGSALLCEPPPMRRWFSKGNKGQLARQPSQSGTTLFTQETEFLFFL